ncbi:MAG TPA: MFS transporter [Verrucomicrobiae bacterium]|nr:MFS transporter [Verrucomicrobiae bacterium]
MAVRAPARSRLTIPDRHYRWVALSNTTLGILMASLNGTIILISLPAIFRGIHVDPLVPAETSVFLWLIMGYMVVTATLVVTAGRLSDMYGRVRLYNAGFAVFSVGSVLLFLTPGTGNQAAIEMIAFRVVQAVGGAFLFANSAAILTDAFPADRRGLALGLNQIAAIAGSLIGLIVGGVLSSVDYHLVFLVSVPFGILGTVWAYLALRETATIVHGQRVDWVGNLTFAAGLILLLVGVTYALLPYGGSAMGWGNPMVLAMLSSGVALLVLFLVVEARVADPMFQLSLFRVRAFAAANLAGLLASVGRGGLQFMLIIWLQGIWLPLHGYSYTETPLWSGLYLAPMMIGFVLLGPVSGFLSDRFGARSFATGGMLLTVVAFVLLIALPSNFGYPAFAAVLLLMGVGMGLFAAPNTTAIMNAVPARHRGVASGMRSTFQNAGMLVSMGIFFTIVISGLASALPASLLTGLTHAGLPTAAARSVSHLPPTAALFSAFLGYNPMAHLIPASVLQHLPAAARGSLLGERFFPHLITAAFMRGLHLAFLAAAALSLVAALASLLRGGRYLSERELPSVAAGVVRSGAGPSG